MDIKQVNENELNKVLNILKDAAEWLKNKNIDYWQNWHDPPQNHINWIHNGLKKNQFYFVHENDSFLGMFRLQYQDEMFWGEKNDKSGYIHSFTTNRKLSNKEIGYKILNKIEKDLKSDGYNYIRLDCGIHLQKLCNYYINYGFKEVGKTIVGGEKLVLLEKLL